MVSRLKLLLGSAKAALTGGSAMQKTLRDLQEHRRIVHFLIIGYTQPAIVKFCGESVYCYVVEFGHGSGVMLAMHSMTDGSTGIAYASPIDTHLAPDHVRHAPCWIMLSAYP